MKTDIIKETANRILKLKGYKKKVIRGIKLRLSA